MLFFTPTLRYGGLRPSPIKYYLKTKKQQTLKIVFVVFGVKDGT